MADGFQCGGMTLHCPTCFCTSRFKSQPDEVSCSTELPCAPLPPPPPSRTRVVSKRVPAQFPSFQRGESHRSLRGIELSIWGWGQRRRKAGAQRNEGSGSRGGRAVSCRSAKQWSAAFEWTMCLARLRFGRDSSRSLLSLRCGSCCVCCCVAWG